MAKVAPDVPVITFGGLSKNYLAPGWRIGWGIASGEASRSSPTWKESTSCCGRDLRQSSRAVCDSGRADGPQDHLIEVKRKLRSRRDLTMKWCKDTQRVSCVAPRGAFYAYPRIDIPEGDDVFVTELIRQKYVMVVHGSGFGQRPGTKHFRIVFLPEEKRSPRPTPPSPGFMASAIGKRKLGIDSCYRNEPHRRIGPQRLKPRLKGSVYRSGYVAAPPENNSGPKINGRPSSAYISRFSADI